MTLHNRLEAVFREVFDDETIVLHDETTASDIEDWDSLAHITLMYGIEAEFGIQFTANEFAEFTNVGDLKRSLASKGGAVDSSGLRSTIDPARDAG